MSKIVYYNIGRVYTADVDGGYGRVRELTDVQIIVDDEKIEKIVPDSQEVEADQRINCRGLTLLPGFVDAHTHPVFYNSREEEFIMRIQGKTYEEIAAAGGGIRNSVRKFRRATKEEIKALTRQRIHTFLEYGTTTIEAKSGYGLSTEDELKSLEIISELNDEQNLEMVPTFLGAHEIPDEYQSRREDYIRLLCDEMIPRVAERKLARFCDVFCEKGVFTVDESRRILECGKQYGLIPKLHADELYPFGGAELSAEVKAISADHLLEISDEGIARMAENRVIAVLLPGTTFFLGKDGYAPARKMLDNGLDVAIATDFNPGSSTTQNLQLIWTISALKMKMLPGEILWATTCSAARAIRMENRIGRIEEGMQADFVVLDIPNLDYLPYHYGINHTVMTIKKGHIVYRKAE
ncbi:MAG TPA: imidazolonepropionase [Caldithrix abyssi]|uniref:Imidazolonepropionase n=1 Tax=Caldithrix abyssi TaxID=187145 RepID=A0A7V1LPC8_CALAY|nr:imidazolonepropionase [Caldithrix abyssi]